MVNKFLSLSLSHVARVSWSACRCTRTRAVVRRCVGVSMTTGRHCAVRCRARLASPANYETSSTVRARPSQPSRITVRFISAFFLGIITTAQTSSLSLPFSSFLSLSLPPPSLPFIPFFFPPLLFLSFSHRCKNVFSLFLFWSRFLRF